MAFTAFPVWHTISGKSETLQTITGVTTSYPAALICTDTDRMSGFK